MQYRPDLVGPSEHELRMRAAIRVARRRAFTVSAAVLGSLILLNLYLYSTTKFTGYLLLDVVFGCLLAYRAYHAFGSNAADEARIRREMDRMRGGF